MFPAKVERDTSPTRYIENCIPLFSKTGPTFSLILLCTSRGVCKSCADRRQAEHKLKTASTSSCVWPFWRCASVPTLKICWFSRVHNARAVYVLRISLTVLSLCNHILNKLKVLWKLKDLKVNKVTALFCFLCSAWFKFVQSRTVQETLVDMGHSWPCSVARPFPKTAWPQKSS